MPECRFRMGRVAGLGRHRRVLRATLKAADLCESDPARVARRLVDGGFTPRYEYALQALREIPYDKCASTTQRTRSVLCVARTRRGLHQVDPANDHRRRHRLALPRRGQTRAEGVNRAHGYWSGFVGWPLSNLLLYSETTNVCEALAAGLLARVRRLAILNELSQA